MLTAPIVHYRYVDHTHYLLKCNWVILLLIYLVISRNTSWLTWSFLSLPSITIFPYYAVFVGLVALTYFTYLTPKREISIGKTLSIVFLNIATVCLAMIISGYFFMVAC